MRKTRLLLLLPLFLISAVSSAQTSTPVPLSGIVNTYHKVVGIDGGKDCVVVDNATGLAAGNRVMLVQMKGANVITNSSGFGTIDNLNNAGNYELNTICRVNGDSVFLLNEIKNQYTPAGKVQLVYIPEYENAVVVDSLKAKPWDNGAGKGGVLALHVLYHLSLNAPMSATGAGFKGGMAVLSNGDCGNYFFAASGLYYDAANKSPQNGAYKGESVYEPARPEYTGGKAALANGGGGGNNHNNGGAGGANLSKGGNGGGNNSSDGCIASNPGQGGNALDPNGGAKIYLGGGGGAGHVNTGYILKGGGDGGGIVYIQAQSLTSNGRAISANGLKGGDAIGDGASGGGAGGTIILNVASYGDGVIIEAKGGNGGQEDDEFNNQRCYGEGGGGSGGVIYFRNTTPAGMVNVSGGAKGNKINSDNIAPVCNAPIPSVEGTPGVTTTGYTPVEAMLLAPSCTFVLPTTLLYFKAVVSGKDVTTRWQVVLPQDVRTFVVERRQEEGWREAARVAPVEGVDTYTATDRNLSPGSYTYRLKIVEKDGAVVYSPVQRVAIASALQLTVFPNPARGLLHVVLPEDAGNELKVYDLSGRLVLRKGLTGTRPPVVSLDVTPLAEGLYVLRTGVLYKVFRIQ